MANSKCVIPHLQERKRDHLRFKSVVYCSRRECLVFKSSDLKVQHGRICHLQTGALNCKKEEEVFQAQDGKFSRGFWHRAAPEWAQDQCWSSRQRNQVEQPSKHGRTSTKHGLSNQQRPVEQQGIHYRGELQGL